MALVVNDRVQQTGTANTTVSFTLTGTVLGFQSFAIIGNGNITYYAATDTSGNWEVGIGTYSTTGPTLTRTTILSSSNSGSAVTFSGTVTVFVTYPSEKSINYDANGVATIGSTLGYSDSGIIGSFASTVTGYNQVIIQNKSNANNASSNVNVSNDVSTSTTGFAELGINSSTFSGSGSFNLPGAAYLASASTDLAIGTYGAYNIHFVTNSNTTDAMTIFNSGGVSLGGQPDPGIGTLYANNVYLGFNVITAAAGTTTLTNASSAWQQVVGTTTQTIQLPNATTLYKGLAFTIANNSTGVVTIKDSAGTTVDTLVGGAVDILVLTANGTSAGTWSAYSYVPSTYDFSTTTANFGGATITNAIWNGTAIGTAYGGTGLTTFTAANNALYSTSSSALTAGTLPVPAGGTGQTSFAAGYIPYGNTSAALQSSSLLQFNGTYLQVGGGSVLGGATNPIAAFSQSANNYVQTYVYNNNTGISTSSDFVAYTNNSTDAHGWADMGFTGSNYADTVYTVTGPNEAYLFGSAPSASGTSGNLVFATDNTGTANAFQWYVGGFTQAKSAYKMQLGSSYLELKTPLYVTGSTGTSGQVLTSAGSGAAPTWTSPTTGGGTVTTTDFTATAGQTVFTVTYTVGATEVYQNGVKLGIADFTATNGTSITLATGATAGDLIEVVTFSSLNLYSTITYQDFSGTGSQTVFTMSAVPANSASLLVAISGVVQDPGTYTVSSNTLTFTTAPPTGTNNISVRYLGVATTGSSFSAGTTGLTPASATTGAVTLAGTLNIANGGTGITSFGTGVQTALGQAVTGSGGIALSTSPVFVTPTLGAASATSINTSGTETAGAFVANKTITGALNAGAFSYGTLAYTDIDIFGSYTISANAYAQKILQNTNSGASASVDFVISNNLGTATTYYGDFGITSSGYNSAGTNITNTPNTVYLQAVTTGLAIGTLNSNTVTFYANSTQSAQISTAGVWSFVNDASISGLTVGKGGGAVASGTVLGVSAGVGNSVGTSLTAIGYLAGTASTADANTFIGSVSGTTNTSGTENTALGTASMRYTTTGSQLTAIGRSALSSNTTGSANTAVGKDALISNTTASNNTAVGYQAGYSNTTGIFTAIGYQAGYSNTTGNYNTFVGNLAGNANTTSSETTAVGYQAGRLSTGADNTYLGTYAGYSATTGTFNCYVGSGAGFSMTTGGKNTILGSYNGNQGGLDIRTNSNFIVLSDGDGNPRGFFNNDGNFIINYTSALARHTVANNTSYNYASVSIGNNADHIIFKSDSTTTGSINRVGGTGVIYNTTSDYRLKENVMPMTGSLDKVLQLKPVTYTWKLDGSNGQGFIAHELQAIIPDAVSGEKDAVDENGVIVAQGIDQSRIVATLTAAIQEQQAMIEELKTKVAVLEAK